MIESNMDNKTMKIIQESDEIKELIQKEFLSEITSLTDTNTPEFKEGLVVYFSSLPSSKLTAIEDKLSKVENDQKKISLLPPKNDKFYGPKSFKLVVNAIEHLSSDAVKQSEKTFYYNALSVAKKIQEIYKKPVQADRGDQTYTKIRKKAVDLIQSGYGMSTSTDKWCPADIYIYNNPVVVSKLLSAKSLNLGDDSLNAQFQPEIENTTEGVTGISLKEEKAQAGKAASFVNALNKKDNYPDAPVLSSDAKYILSIAYNYDQAISNLNKNPQKAIGYITVAHASSNILSSKFKEAVPVQNQFLKILKSTFGSSDLQSIQNRNGRYDKESARELFGKKGLSSFVMPTSLKKDIDTLFDKVRKSYENEYKKARKSFLEVLVKNKMDVPSQTPDIKSMNMETLLKKTSCYRVASWVLDGVNSESLNIPNIYQSIIRERNAFVAMTAYAIGMAGISPTFFKMVGNSKGGAAHVETFYGSGFLNLDEKEKVIIGDTPARKGFFVEFITTVKTSPKKSSKIVRKYKVSLDFRFSGEQINIEVSELKSI